MIGVPQALHSDNAKEFKHGNFAKKCRKFDVIQSFTEPHSPWQNCAEIGIKEGKSYGKRILAQQNAPIRLWCFAYEYAATILCLSATGLFDLEGRTPYEQVMGNTPDISEYTTFHWYQWSYYWDQIDCEKRLCRWLGVASEIGQSMSYWILTANGEFLARSTVIPIPISDINSDDVKQQVDAFTASVHDTIGGHKKAIIFQGPINQNRIVEELFEGADENDNTDATTYPWDTELLDEPLYDMTRQDLEALDEYINAKVVVPGKDGETKVLATVKGRKRDAQGNLIGGSSNSNPILDTRLYNLEFPDGHVETYPTNLIAEALYDQVDANGFNHDIFHEI